jgi:hypothetical protein
MASPIRGRICPAQSELSLRYGGIAERSEFAVSEQYSFRCPLCDRRFVDDIADRRHLIGSTTCGAVEAILRLQILLADRDEAVAVARVPSA